MKLQDEFRPIRDWAYNKGILKHGDSKTQTLKLQEEVGELASAILKSKPKEVKDAIGDIVVVLTSIAYFNGLTIEDCINSAYSEIKNRTGQIKDGNFVKEEQPTLGCGELINPNAGV
jgi:NTP pyrophosphatase (non-canonical NTP hydrolase)